MNNIFKPEYPKVSLCFILNYEHKLIKEDVWRKWIEPNKDIINVVFYYKDFDKIKSDWIKKYAIPPKSITETSYYYVLPAYLALMRFSLYADNASNEWIVFLTDFCSPIISPKRFRYLFFKNYKHSIMDWRQAWWNTETNYRANLKLIPENLHLANSPWFILSRTHASLILDFINLNPKMAKMIFDGIVANESFFAIALEKMNALRSPIGDGCLVIKENSHISDWTRMSSATSPHIFSNFNDINDKKFIEHNILLDEGTGRYRTENKTMFLRKVAETLPNSFLENYIYDWNKSADDLLIINTPFEFYLPRIIRHNKLNIIGFIECIGTMAIIEVVIFMLLPYIPYG